MKTFLLLAITFFVNPLCRATELRTFEISYRVFPPAFTLYSNSFEDGKIRVGQWMVRGVKGEYDPKRSTLFSHRRVVIEPMTLDTTEFLGTLSKESRYSCDIRGQFRARKPGYNYEDPAILMYSVNFAAFEIVACREQGKRK